MNFRIELKLNCVQLFYKNYQVSLRHIHKKHNCQKETNAVGNLLVRPFTAVRSHVCGDTARLRELAVADTAVERFFTAVRSAMSGQICGLRKRLVAVVTTVRSFA